MSKKAQEKIMTIHDYIAIVEKLQTLKKENPNNFEFGTKIRSYLTSIEKGTEYVEVKTSL